MQAIGVFDSGFGGLTILKSLQESMPEYDFIYLGDNARAPYGEKSFELVNKYSTQAVDWLFNQGCPLIILACNTASALALRNIQQIHLKKNYDDDKRVLGVVRPSTEVIGNFSKTKNIGLLGTPGTVESNSYGIEISKFFPEVTLYQESCPLWVPMIEHGTYTEDSSKSVVEQNIQTLLGQDSDIDTILLACTHYPILLPIINEIVPNGIRVIPQGEIIAQSLKDYFNRHLALSDSISKNGQTKFFTTDVNVEKFMEKSTPFYSSISHVNHTNLDQNDS